jgi:hypothetical protein
VARAEVEGRGGLARRQDRPVVTRDSTGGARPRRDEDMPRQRVRSARCARPPARPIEGATTQQSAEESVESSTSILESVSSESVVRARPRAPRGSRSRAPRGSQRR